MLLPGASTTSARRISMPSSTPATDQTTRGLAAQLPRNLAANIAYFLVNVAIGVLLVPYFINTLGVAAYGLIPLATSITGYVAIVVQSLNTSVSRFLTVDLQRGDYVASRILSRTINAISWQAPLKRQSRCHHSGGPTDATHNKECSTGRGPTGGVRYTVKVPISGVV